MDPDQLDAIARIGYAGAATAAVIALVRGYVRRGKEVDEVRADSEARITQIVGLMQKQTDDANARGNEWKEIALGAIDRLDRVVTIFEDATGSRLPD